MPFLSPCTRNNRNFSVLSTTLFCPALLILISLFLAACHAGRPAQLEEKPSARLLPGKGINVYAAGNIADCRKHLPHQSGAAKTAALIASRIANDKSAIVLTLGDHTYPVGLPDEFSNCYGPTWGQFKARTYPSPGNHEYYSPQAFGYYNYFGATAGPERRGYYSFNVGSWHLISLNSFLKPEEHKAQLEWLKADLEKNVARCTLAYWHHPLYSSGRHGGNTRMKDAWTILYAANADLVLASHDHHYERFASQNADGLLDNQRGMREFVVGTGGAYLSPLRLIQDNSQTSDNSMHGVLKLTLKENGYEWEFLSVDEDSFMDRGTTLCH